MSEAPADVFKIVTLRNAKQFKELLAQGLDIRAHRNARGQTLLTVAMDYNADEIALAIVDTGIQILPEEMSLIWAIRMRRPDIVKRYIELGADVNISCGYGTPLSMSAGPPGAVVPGPPELMLEIMKTLIDAGADLDAGSMLGSPIERAIERKAPAAVKMLIEAGASLKPSKHSPYKSLSEGATKTGQLDLAKYLAEQETNPPKVKKRAPRVSTNDDPNVAMLEALCGGKSFPFDGVPDAVTVHVNSAKKLNLEKIQRDFLKCDRFVFATTHEVTRLAMLRTTDKYEVVKLMSTNGDNYELSNDDIVTRLRELEETDPFVLTGVGFDFLQGKFLAKAKDPEALARWMYNFCPDVVDQGLETVEALAKQLRKSRNFFFWWD